MNECRQCGMDVGEKDVKRLQQSFMKWQRQKWSTCSLINIALHCTLHVRGYSIVDEAQEGQLGNTQSRREHTMKFIQKATQSMEENSCIGKCNIL